MEKYTSVENLQGNKHFNPCLLATMAIIYKYRLHNNLEVQYGIYTIEEVQDSVIL